MASPGGVVARRILAPAFLLVAATALPAAGAEPGSGKQPRPPRATRPAPQPAGPSLCPEEVSVEQRVTAVPQGWEASHSDAKARLAMVTFFDGPPADRASLKFDREEKRKGEWVGIWTFQPGSRGYWVQCAYDNTNAVLSRRLPDGVAGCTVTYERNTRVASGLPAVRHVGCK